MYEYGTRQPRIGAFFGVEPGESRYDTYSYVPYVSEYSTIVRDVIRKERGKKKKRGKRIWGLDQAYY